MMHRFNHWVWIVSKIFNIEAKSILGTQEYEQVDMARAMLHDLCIMDEVSIQNYWSNFLNASIRQDYLKQPLNKVLLNWTYNLYK